MCVMYTVFHMHWMRLVIRPTRKVVFLPRFIGWFVSQSVSSSTKQGI